MKNYIILFSDFIIIKATLKQKIFPHKKHWMFCQIVNLSMTNTLFHIII